MFVDSDDDDSNGRPAELLEYLSSLVTSVGCIRLFIVLYRHLPRPLLTMYTPCFRQHNLNKLSYFKHNLFSDHVNYIYTEKSTKFEEKEM